MTTKRYPEDAVPEMLECCGITAQLALWNAVGLRTKNWVGGQVEFPARDGMTFGSRQAGATDAELIEARVTTGKTDEQALIWLIRERRRQAEETARNQAAYEAAQAQKKAGDDAIHAARIERQAAELRALAAGVHGNAINSRLR